MLDEKSGNPEPFADEISSARNEEIPNVHIDNGISLDPAVCAILVPVATEMERQCQQALAELGNRGYEVRTQTGLSAIDYARSFMVTEALSLGFDEILFIDGDIAFNPNDVEKLRAHGKDFICGAYMQKGSGFLTTQFESKERIPLGSIGGLHKVKTCGMGFNLIRREVFECVEELFKLPTCGIHCNNPLVPYFMPMIIVENGFDRYLCEDMAFCHRAKKAGFELWCDTSISLWHIGKYGFSFHDYGKTMQQFFNDAYEGLTCVME